jgi:hypothetical protein
MPYPDRPTWSGSGESAFSDGPALCALGNALAALLEQADLREVLRKSAQIVGLRGSLALPRQIANVSGAQSPLHGLQAVVELVGGATSASHGFALALPVEQAAALVDRLLGGPGVVGIASKVGALSDAECGVLAYLASRCCVASRAQLRVADVHCQSATQLAARWPNGVGWAVRLESPELAFDACALFADAVSCAAEELTLELLVRDELSADALAPLEPGDLLLSDRWPLTATTRGLEGLVELHVPGCQERLVGQLQGETLRTTGRRATAHGAELLLGTVRVELAQLSALCSGGELRLGPNWLQRAVLRVEGRPVLAGQLVQYAGSIGLTASELYSIR